MYIIPFLLYVSEVRERYSRNQDKGKNDFEMYFLKITGGVIS